MENKSEVEKVQPAVRSGREILWGVFFSLASFLVILSATFFVRQRFEIELERENQVTFERARDILEKQIENEISGIQGVLFSIKGLFDSSEEVTREVLETFNKTLNLRDRFPSLLTVAYVQAVKEGEIAKFERELRRDYPEASIVTSDGPYNYIVRFETSVRGSSSAVGFDVTSEPTRKVVFDRARDTGEPSMSVDFISISDPGTKVFLVALPIYKNGLPTSTVDERRIALEGFAAALYIKDVFFGDILDRIQTPGIDIEVYQGSKPDPGRILFDSRVDATEAFSSQSGAITGWSSYDFLGQVWRIFYSYHPDETLTMSQRELPDIFLYAGITIAFLVAMLVFLLASARTKAVKVAIGMTGEMEKFKLAVDNASSHIILTDPDGTILYANKAVEQTTGYTVEEVVGKNPRLWGGLMGNEFYQKMWHQVKVERRPFKSEIRNRRKNGQEYTVIATISPIIDEHNNLIGFVGLEDDITERIKSEEILKSSEQRYRSLFENMLDGFAYCQMIYDADGKPVDFIYLDVNPRFEVLTGLKDVVGKKVSEVIPGIAKSNPELFKIYGEAASLGVSQKFETYVPQLKIWFSISVYGNQKGYFVAVFSNVTKEKEATADLLNQKLNLEEAKAKDEAILAGIGDGVVVVDVSGNITLMNNVGLKLLGWKHDEIVGRPYHEIWRLKDSLGNTPTSERPVSRSLREMVTISTSEFSITKKDGSDLPVHITASPVKRGKTITGAIMVFHDISQERAIDRAKTEFVSLASHQLRTPLSAINWYAEMLLNGDLGAIEPGQKQYLEEIYESNKRMVDLVNALLNVSRIDLGTFTIDPEPTNVIEIAKSVVSELKPQIVIKKLQLKESYDPDVPVIQADTKLTRILFQNLMTNAVKYTSVGGKVALEVRRLESGTTEGGRRITRDGILIKVADNGMGIPESQKDKIFGKLFRADNVKEKDTEGTGLGLYIVNSIVGSVGGAVWFESVENQGTTFYIVLPIAGMPKRVGTKKLNYDVFSRIIQPK